MNRRGVELVMAAIVVLILGAGLIIFFAMFFSSFFTGASGEFTQKECQQSLLLTKAVEDRTNFLDSCLVPGAILPIKCDRKFLTVEGTEVYSTVVRSLLGTKRLGGKPEVTEQYNATCPAGFKDKGDQCLAENVLAEEMAQCWQTFFQGEVKVLQQAEISSTKVFTEKDAMRSCFICSEVTLRKTKVGKNDLYSYFKEYLKLQQYDAERTYYDFLAKNPKAVCDSDLVKAVEEANRNSPAVAATREPTCWEGIANAFENENVGIPGLRAIDYMTAAMPLSNEERTYAIVFMRRGLGTCEDMDPEETELDHYLSYAVHAVPADQISSYCSTVVV